MGTIQTAAGAVVIVARGGVRVWVCVGVGMCAPEQVAEFLKQCRNGRSTIELVALRRHNFKTATHVGKPCSHCIRFGRFALLVWLSNTGRVARYVPRRNSSYTLSCKVMKYDTYAQNPARDSPVGSTNNKQTEAGWLFTV